MAIEEQAVHTGKKAVDRVLPTHELRARQRRKQAVRLKSDPKSQGPRDQAAVKKASDPGALAEFYGQFPPRTPVE